MYSTPRSVCTALPKRRQIFATAALYCRQPLTQRITCLRHVLLPREHCVQPSIASKELGAISNAAGALCETRRLVDGFSRVLRQATVGSNLRWPSRRLLT